MSQPLIAASRNEPWVEVLASRHLTEWMNDQQVSLGATTYQANKLCLFGLGRAGNLCLFERTFPRCMGLAADSEAQTLWLSSQFQLWRLENAPRDSVARLSHFACKRGYKECRDSALFVELGRGGLEH